MTVKIIGVKGDPKFVDVVALARQADYTVDDMACDDKTQALKEAAAFAGRVVRLPHVFVGKYPAKGQRWPRERCGGKAWFENYLTEPKRERKPAGKKENELRLVDRVVKLIDNPELVARAHRLIDNTGVAVEQGFQPSFADGDGRFNVNDFHLALQIERARSLGLQGQIGKLIREKNAEIRKVQRDSEARVKELEFTLSEARQANDRLCEKAAESRSDFRRAGFLARRVQDRAEAVHDLLQTSLRSIYDSADLSHARHEASSAASFARQLRELTYQREAGQAATDTPPGTARKYDYEASHRIPAPDQRPQTAAERFEGQADKAAARPRPDQAEAE